MVWICIFNFQLICKPSLERKGDEAQGHSSPPLATCVVPRSGKVGDRGSGGGGGGGGGGDDDDGDDDGSGGGGPSYYRQKIQVMKE